jgi:multicomponent K+:H+ antiporter subunit D
VTALVLAVALVPLAAAPLPALMKRSAGLDPALPALGAVLTSFALALALLPAVLPGATLRADWPWVPALGLSLSLRADGLAVGVALMWTAGSAIAIAAARLDPRGGATPRFYGRAIALTGAVLGAALADDLALLWLCLELAALATVLLIGEGPGAGRRRAALGAFVAMEAGGLALLAAAVLIADVAGSFRLSAAIAAGAELRAQPLYPLMAALVCATAVTRLAPLLVRAAWRRAVPQAGAALAAAALVPLRLTPALGGTRTWLVLLTVLGTGAALLVAWRAWRGRRAGPTPATAAPGAALLEGFALAARVLWQPLVAPRLTLSLAALGVGAALAAALAAGGVRPQAWPALASPAWPIAAGSSWLLLAVAACAVRDRADRAARTLGIAAVAALLLLAAFVPATIVGAELAAGAAVLWLLGRTLGMPSPPRPALLALGACLAIEALIRALVAGSAAALAGDDVGHGAGPAGFALVAPLALPLVAAVALVALGPATPALKRSLAGIALLANCALAAWLLLLADRGAPLGLALGAGPAPFGLHLLLDRLAATMLLIGAVVALLVFGHALGGGAERRNRHFHALCQLQVCGLAGAVLAAELVELFVFGELALLAFHVLLAHDASVRRAAARRHVVVVGAAGAGLFLIATGCVYAALGTLNFAELAVRAPAIAVGDSPLLRVGAYLLIVVFALRTAALPLGFWLPGACGAAPAAAAFVVALAEAGVYAILRLYGLVFPCFGAGPCGPSGLVLPLGLATLAGGGVGALAATGLGGLRAPLLLVALGTLLVGVGSFREAGFAAALYLLAPAAIGAVALVLVGDLVGRVPDAAAIAPPRRDAAAVRATLGFAALLAALGLPPFAGWVGRIAILAASGPDALVVWSFVLVAALIAAIAAARTWSAQRWQAPPTAARIGWARGAAAGCALATLAALALAAGPIFDLAGRTARQLFDRRAYVAALIGVDAGPAAR